MAKFEELKKKAANDNSSDVSPLKNPAKLRRKSSFDISDILKLSKENKFGLDMDKIAEEEDDYHIESRNSGFSLDRRSKRVNRK